jgi:DNA modification methylase
MEANSIQCVVTSPPYFGLRDYGNAAQIGLEQTPSEYVAKMVAVFRELRRVLADDGVAWLNLGDSYASSTKGTGGPSDKQLSNAGSRYHARRFTHGVKDKDLMGIPWRVAFALQDDGWYLRSDVIWHKPNPMPESVTDRPTKAHEYVFLLTKQARYYYDADAVKEKASQPVGEPSLVGQIKRGELQDLASSTLGSNQGYGTRNRRSVWTIATKPYKGAHFATMPPALVEPCILAGSRKGDTILDPFSGSGTVGAVAIQHGRKYIGIELNADYIELAKQRIDKAVNQQPALLEVA